MDIDDILADLGPSPLLPPETKDLQALTRAWVTERCAPEILPWPESLMERVLERINAQVFSRFLSLFSLPGKSRGTWEQVFFVFCFLFLADVTRGKVD